MLVCICIFKENIKAIHRYTPPFCIITNMILLIIYICFFIQFHRLWEKFSISNNHASDKLGCFTPHLPPKSIPQLWLSPLILQRMVQHESWVHDSAVEAFPNTIGRDDAGRVHPTVRIFSAVALGVHLWSGCRETYCIMWQPSLKRGTFL